MNYVHDPICRTPSVAMLRKGDKVVFSYGAKNFLGTATLDSDSFELTEEQKNSICHGQDFFRADFGVTLKDIEIWKEQKSVEKNIDSLAFVIRKHQYPAYFQGGIKKISKEDYNIITNISETKVTLSFIDLQRFLLEEMQMQANYQPIMIKTLLLAGGRATKDNIASEIKELNPGKPDTDFNNIPVYDVLERRRIVRKQSNGDFVLNSVELSGE